MDSTLIPNVETCEHVWHPVVDITQPPHKWLWTCRECEKDVVGKPPGTEDFASLRELEAMVDSSLRVADVVQEDNQSVKGEMWIMRNARWRYWPFDFQMVSHVFHSDPFVMLFKVRKVSQFYKVGTLRGWTNVRDTASYAALLQEADISRRSRR